jgi:RNA polymerase sigma-70 factor (ECF subfamily)
VLSERDLILCELLVLRCRRKDSQAAAELTALFQQPLLYYLRRLLNSEADAWDALQETWLTAFRSLHMLREPRALPAFLYSTARNAALAQLRRQRNAAALMNTLEENTQEPDSAGEAFSFEDAVEVHAALDRLTLPHREVLALFFLQDLSIDGIAAVLSVPAGTVKSRLFHAKRALRAVMTKGADHA